MDRKELLKNLKIFREKLKEDYKIKEVILFGSRANGKFRKDSDVDLIIVGNFQGKNGLKRVPPLYEYWKIDLPVDFICYTPVEYEKLKKKVSIVREALKSGIIIE